MNVKIICEEAYETSIWCKQIVSGLVLELKKKRQRYIKTNQIEQIQGNSVIYLIGANHNWLEHAILLCNSKGVIPVVLCNQDNRRIRGQYHCVCADIYGSMKQLCDNFFQMGKTKIALYGVNLSSVSDQSRMECFLEVTSDEKSVFENDGNLEECYQKFLPYIREYQAVICVNSYAAISLVNKLKVSERDLLDKICIVSCTKTVLSSWYSQWISFVELNLEEYGKAALTISELAGDRPYISGITITIEADVSEIAQRKSCEGLQQQYEYNDSFYEDSEWLDLSKIEHMLNECSEFDRQILALLLQGATLIDGNGGTPIEDSVILVEGERIAKVGSYGQVNIPEEAECFDITGKYVIPGLIEGHAHFGGYGCIPTLQKSLQRGITSLACVCSGEDGIKLRNTIRDQKLRGCAKIIAGCIVTPTHGHVKDEQYGPADGPWEVRRAVRHFSELEADFIKTAASGGFWSANEKCAVRNYTYEELEALVDEAHAWDMKCVVHAHTQPGINNAVRAGVDQIHHGGFIDEDGVRNIKAANLYYMPTLRVTSIRNLEGWPHRPWMQEEMALAHPVNRAGLKLAHEIGVKIMVGTDYPGSAAIWEKGESTAYEMMEMQACGMTPMELITAATKTNAEGYGKEHEIGTVEAGKFADIVVLNKTPLEDISVLHEKETICMVFRDGILEYTDDQFRDHYRISYYAE